MKKYQITIRDKGETTQSDEVEASSPKEAYEKYVASNKPIPFKRISVNWGMFGADGFDPPHYEGHVGESQDDESSETMKNDTENPTQSNNKIDERVVKLQTFSSPSLEAKIDKLNENLNFLKRYIVLITIALFVLMSWTALGATGSWWKWFAFFTGN